MTEEHSAFASISLKSVLFILWIKCRFSE